MQRVLEFPKAAARNVKSFGTKLFLDHPLLTTITALAALFALLVVFRDDTIVYKNNLVKPLLILFVDVMLKALEISCFLILQPLSTAVILLIMASYNLTITAWNGFADAWNTALSTNSVTLATNFDTMRSATIEFINHKL